MHRCCVKQPKFFTKLALFMKFAFTVGLWCSLICITSTLFAQKNVYLFSYFKGNGEDGLHLAYSYDGLQFKALKGDSSFLTPTVSKDKLMRDPCILKGPDGYFHMVWSLS